MKIINLGRGQGKTTRLLYASEFNDMPILCANGKHKENLQWAANKLGLMIPEPIIVYDLFSNKIRGRHIDEDGILVDDAEWVLQQVLHYAGLHSEIKAISVTKDS